MITRLDRLFLERAYELAARGVGGTSPNPPVGAVIARGDRVLGEGYHHRAGTAHAESHALAAAGDARGATLYVSLEPCTLSGRTPACTQAVLEAQLARVVIGARDPTENGGGAAALRAHGVDVSIAEDGDARELVAAFARAAQGGRPYVALKMAMSLDGYVTSRPGVSEWITGEEARLFVRDLRVRYDAVMVGAGTVRIDDPQLTIRPPAQLEHPKVRVVACERESLSPESRVFSEAAGYARTIALAPAGARERFASVERVAEVLYIGDDRAQDLDLDAALHALRERDIASILCEGGPTLAAHLIARGLVDRFYWILAPVLLYGVSAVPVLAGDDLRAGPRGVRFERCERVGKDLVLCGDFADV